MNTNYNSNSTDQITFYLNGELITESSFDPQTIVLDYLREQRNLRGSKEGCAEGDCGACTAVALSMDKTADSAESKLRYNAVNTCIQLLTTLDGKHLITVEALKKDGLLHPIQQTLVDNHGSQCGFCTPGFIMSLFAMYHSPQSSTRSKQEICDVLAGNLCRCTGYGPIIESAQYIETLRQKNVTDQFDELHAELLQQLQAIEPKQLLQVKRQSDSKETTLYKPTTETQLTDLLDQNPSATIVNGATDVGLWITKQFRELPALIYIGEIASLTQISETDSTVTLPANVTYQQALPVFDAHYPELANMVRRIGSTQVRNAGTVCGNIANGSPIGDMPPALMVLDSTLILKSSKGERQLPLADFFISYGKQDLADGEYVYAVEIPKPNNAGNDDCSFFMAQKVTKRFDQDITAVLMAAHITVDRAVEGGTVIDCKIAYGGMAGTPMYAKSAMETLTGSNLTEQNFNLAAESLSRDFNPMSDQRASAEYRLLCGQNLLRKIFWKITEPDAIPEMDRITSDQLNKEA